MDTIGAEDAFAVIAQGITGSGSDIDFTKIAMWVAGILVGFVILVATWRLFKNYLSSGQNGAVVAPEDRAKQTASIMIDAGIAMAGILVVIPFVTWVAKFITDKV
ncbi:MULTISPECIES: hypothetical protein [Rhodococcus]|jgi:hypothetical protein|uniref:Uncharacterized protein n=2 Tax=Rhodococcus erythropolis group TaxID=2840174 RepID=A0AAW6LLX4_RHOSG|nr:MULTISPECIES: hypothetical protein [Rhodococcus]MDE8647529.1 hypothetical protein [Rhodococcus qingshengii]